MLVILILLALWVLFNLLVVIKYTPNEMYDLLWVYQGKVGRVCGNAFYCLAWLIKIIYYVGKHYLKLLCKKIWQGIKYVCLAIAKFISQVYHSIIDIV